MGKHGGDSGQRSSKMSYDQWKAISDEYARTGQTRVDMFYHYGAHRQFTARYRREQGITAAPATRTRAAAAGTARTPEQQHAEKVARAEAGVRKAQAEVDRIAAEQNRLNATPGLSLGERIRRGHNLVLPELAANTRLKSAQTRLANLKKAGANAPKARSESATKAPRMSKSTYNTRAVSLAEQIADAHRAGNTAARDRLINELDQARSQYRAATQVAPRTGSKARPSIADFTPVKQVPELTYDASKPPNPYLLRQAYGARQFPQLLDFLSLARLREVAGVVQARNPGTRPRTSSRKADVIDYIVEHVREG